MVSRRMPSAQIFHLTEPAAWAAATAEGAYRLSTRGRTLPEVGFVHCACRGQVLGHPQALRPAVPIAQNAIAPPYSDGLLGERDLVGLADGASGRGDEIDEVALPRLVDAPAGDLVARVAVAVQGE